MSEMRGFYLDGDDLREVTPAPERLERAMGRRVSDGEVDFVVYVAIDEANLSGLLRRIVHKLELERIADAHAKDLA